MGWTFHFRTVLEVFNFRLESRQVKILGFCILYAIDSKDHTTETMFFFMSRTAETKVRKLCFPQEENRRKAKR